MYSLIVSAAIFKHFLSIMGVGRQMLSDYWNIYSGQPGDVNKTRPYFDDPRFGKPFLTACTWRMRHPFGPPPRVSYRYRPRR